MDDTNNTPVENEQEPKTAAESYEDFLKRQENVSPAEGNSDTAEQDGASESFDEFMSRQENADAATDITDTDAGEADGTDETAEEPEQTAKAKKKRGKTVILTVLLIALIAVAGILAWNLFGKQVGGDYSAAVLTVDGETSDGYEFAASFGQYWEYYSYYGMADTATVRQNVIDQLAYINMTAKAAKEENLSLTEEEIADAEEQISSITQAAEDSSVTTDELIRERYGVAIPLDSLRAINEKQALAQKYISKVVEDKRSVYYDDDSAVEAEYKENKSNYDACDVSVIALESAEDAVHISDAVADGKSLEDAVKEIAPDADIRPLAGYTYDVLSQSFSQTAADWIFKADDDGNYITAAGSVTVTNIQGTSYVICQNAAPARDESIGENGRPVWVDTIIDNLAEKDMQTWYEEFTASYKDKITTDDAAINTIITAVTGQTPGQTTTAAAQVIN